MSQVFVIRNQLGHYWGKAKLWVDGRDRKALLRVSHRDEAVNTLFELSAKDVELRGDIVAVDVDDKGLPLVEPSDTPLPLELEEAESPAPPPPPADTEPSGP